MKLIIKRMVEIPCYEYVALNTDPLVMRQKPVSSAAFSERIIIRAMRWMLHDRIH